MNSQPEELMRLNESRLEALLKLNQMTEASLKEITDFALEEAVRLTRSKLGYLAFLNDDETVMTMHSWSKAAMGECAIIDKPIVYPVVTTGLWGEAVRQRKPVFTNDYEAPNPLKKGYPAGHVRVLRHMNAPIFDGRKIVIVAGVGNKDDAYDESDLRQLTLLMQGMWRLVQRKRSEEALRESERKMKAVFDQTFQLMGLMTPDGTLIEANRTAIQFAGVSEADVLGKLFWETVWWAHSEPLQLEIREAVAKAARGEFVRLEVTHRGADGRLHWLDFSLKPVRDEAGAVVWLIPESRDITEMKEAENALREVKENFRALADNASDAIFILRADRTIQYVNLRACEVTGRTISDLLSSLLGRLVEPSEQPALHAALEEAYLQTVPGTPGQSPANIQSVFLRSDGERVFVEIAVAPTLWLGEQAFILSVRDIGERKKMEDFKNEIIRNVSHELRTPLHSMREAICILLDGLAGAVSDEQKDVLRTAKANLDRLVRLINTFLDFQSLEAGMIRMNFQEADLNDAVREAVLMMEHSAQGKKLYLRLELDSGLPRVRMDRDRILQVLVNLINNAVKFTEAGGITVSSRRDGNRLVVTVRDTGIGIKTEDRDKLFKKFGQLEISRIMSPVGTGLGLAISREILERHGGTIWLAEAEGPGCHFCIALPVPAV
jgi:PAS domain S-box-containing protein